MSLRLNSRNLKSPLRYDRASVTPGIVHLGVGAFHRAHMAVCVDDILGFDPTWGIIGASLRQPDTREALAPQDFLYTQVVRGSDGDTCRIIGSLVALVDPRIRIVSLTVTEKGYCHDPATGQLNQNHPDILHDLAHPERPKSLPGILALALDLRRQAGVKPFTVLCCDNLPSNGEMVGKIVREFAALGNASLADYIAAEVAFPCTMVDRIVPATTDDDRKLAAQLTGLEDAWPVVTEPFTQWVIEDRFSNGRPDFARVGVQLAQDVAPYEQMKLRLLNGSHSTLAYISCLAGYEFVSDAIADENVLRLIHGLMTNEVMPTLSPQLGDLGGYRDQLLARFSNRTLKHRTAQIAMDGSQKLPQRLLGTIRDRLAKGQSIARLSFGVAAWMRYAMGVNEQGRAIEIKDPMRDRFHAVAESVGREPAKIAKGFLQIKEVFGEDLPRHQGFEDALTKHLTSILHHGMKNAVQRSRD